MTLSLEEYLLVYPSKQAKTEETCLIIKNKWIINPNISYDETGLNELQIKMDCLPWKLSAILALLSPNWFTALHLQFPPSEMAGSLISRDKRYVCFPVSFFIIRIRWSRETAFVPWNQVISGSGSASNTHSITNNSPSCLIDGFFGNRGGFPSGILTRNSGSYFPKIHNKKFHLLQFSTAFEIEVDDGSCFSFRIFGHCLIFTLIITLSLFHF